MVSYLHANTIRGTAVTQQSHSLNKKTLKRISFYRPITYSKCVLFRLFAQNCISHCISLPRNFSGISFLKQSTLTASVKAKFSQLHIILNQKLSRKRPPLQSPYFPFCLTFQGHSNVKLISAKHIGLSVSIVCTFAEHGGKESLKKNPFTLEVRRS